jgi:hypothetical protein
MLGAQDDADHAFGGGGGAFDVGVGAIGGRGSGWRGPALLDGDGVLDRDDRALAEACCGSTSSVCSRTQLDAEFAATMTAIGVPSVERATINRTSYLPMLKR